MPSNHAWPRAIWRGHPADRDEGTRRLLDAHRREWTKHRSLMTFLSTHYPKVWERVQNCRVGQPEVTRSTRGHNEIKVVYPSCHMAPYCPACASEDTIRRAGNAIRTFKRATPNGKPPRFYHLNQGAILYNHGGGWGKEARQDIGKFANIVWTVLQKAYGSGIGAVLTYHEFGSQGWKKSWPHYDITLNGYRLEDGEPKEVPPYNLQAKGAQQWRQWIKEAVDDSGWGPSEATANFDMQRVAIGEPAYWRALTYQLRELVDLRSLKYDMKTDALTWNLSYRSRFETTSYTANEWKEALTEYRIRLRPWFGAGRRKLDRYRGILADTAIETTQAAMNGGNLGHRPDCGCGKCRGWEETHAYRVPEATPLR